MTRPEVRTVNPRPLLGKPLPPDAVSQFEKGVIVAKLRAARGRQRRQSGRCEGRKRFGEHPRQQAVLERMHQLRRKPRGRERISFAAIEAQLNRRSPSFGAAPCAGG
jgi:hypothetical protein